MLSENSNAVKTLQKDREKYIYIYIKTEVCSIKH